MEAISFQQVQKCFFTDILNSRLKEHIAIKINLHRGYIYVATLIIFKCKRKLCCNGDKMPRKYMSPNKIDMNEILLSDMKKSHLSILAKPSMIPHYNKK